MIAVTHLLAAASVCLPHIVETGVAHTSCASPIHQRQSDRESDPDAMDCRDDLCRVDTISGSSASERPVSTSVTSGDIAARRERPSSEHEPGGTHGDADVVPCVVVDALSEPGMGVGGRLLQTGGSYCSNFPAAAVQDPTHRVAHPCMSTVVNSMLCADSEGPLVSTHTVASGLVCIAAPINNTIL